MSRWQAASIHLAISAAIGIATAILIFAVWYPPPYFRAEGGHELLVLLLCMNLGLGPLLTLLVFRSGKRGMKFDLYIIGLVQFAAFGYGMYIAVQSRPVFLVGVIDRFVVVAADEVSDRDLAQGPEPQFRSRSWTGPRLVAVQMPTDRKELSELAFSALAGRDAQNLPKYYVDYASQGSILLKHAESLAALRILRPHSAGLVDAWLNRSRRAEESIRWLPLQARKQSMVMLIDAKTAEPLVALPISPWPD